MTVFDSIKLETSSAALTFKFLGLSTNDIFVIKKVEGLGPPDFNLTSTRNSNSGGYIQNVDGGERKVVILVGLNPNYALFQTPSDLRREIYKLISLNNKVATVTMSLLSSGTAILNAKGRIEQVETPIFEASTEITITIAFQTLTLQNPTQKSVPTAGLSKSNPVAPYFGSAPAGIDVTIDLTAALTLFHFRDSDSQELLRVFYAFAVNDRLRINTIPGSRGVWVTRAGVIRNIVDKADYLDWLTLVPGNNNFDTSSSSFNWVSWYYYEQEWGV